MRYGKYTKEKSPFFNTYPLFNSAPTIVPFQMLLLRIHYQIRPSLNT